MFRIKEICSQRGITLQELAKRLNINYQSLHAAMTGNPTIETLKKIADVLGVQVVDLFDKQIYKHTQFCPNCGGHTFEFRRLSNDNSKDVLCCEKCDSVFGIIENSENDNLVLKIEKYYGGKFEVVSMK